MKKSLLSRLPLAAAGMLLLCGSASAEVIDLGELEVGKTYEMQEFKSYCASFTPTTTEPVKFVYYSSCSPLDLFTSEDHAAGTEISGDHSTTGSDNIYAYKDLTPGTKYYLYIPFVWQGGSFSIETGETQLQVIGVIPELADGAKFSLGDYAIMSVRFNSPVRVGTAVVKSGGQSKVVTPEVHMGTFVDVIVTNQIMQLYKEGAITDGSEVTLTINGVADDVTGKPYNETGVVEVKYTMAAKPAEVVKKNFYFTSEGTNTIDSYYFPGDERAIAVIEFDKPISTDFDPNPTGSATEIEIAKGYIPMAKFKYGNEEDTELTIYQEEVYGVVDGNKVIFDLTGVRRLKLDMLPGASEKQLEDQLGIYFKNMRSEDGQRVYTGSTSNFAGFWATYDINELHNYPSSEFTPAEGELVYGSSMEIWVGDAAGLHFDGVQFDYVKGGNAESTVVPMEDVEVVADPEDASSVLINFEIPELNADQGSDIKLTLKNVMFPDGFEHADAVEATYTAPVPSAVAGIVTEAGNVDVYDVTGKCVLHGATPAQVRGLDKGLYILDGKKILK